MNPLYQSKKNEELFAEEVKVDEKCKTVILKYTTGPDIGKTFPITTATLKRWWRKSIADATTETEPEVFHVKVESDGVSKDVEIKPDDFIPGVDETPITSSEFNVKHEDAKFIPMPESVKRIYMLGESVFPDVETVVDMIVSWGGNVVRFSSFIKLENGTKILFRRNSRNLDKSVIEVVMTEEESTKITSFKPEYCLRKGALFTNLTHIVCVRSIEELEVIIKELNN